MQLTTSHEADSSLAAGRVMARIKQLALISETADMLTAEWKRAEEVAFLDNPRLALGDKAMDAIEKIGHAMNLDFCGVDFSLLPDGRVLVFEANATMLIHPEDADGVLAHKNVYVQRIFDAFNRHVAQLTS